MKIGKVLVVLLQVMVCSCSSTGSDKKISDNYIKILTEGDFKIPSPHSFDILFVKSEDRKIVMTSVNALYAIYRSDFTKDFQQYDKFLSAVLNGDLEIPLSFFVRLQGEYFVPKTHVSEFYAKASPNEFVLKYCEKDSTGGLTLKDSVLKSTDLTTVLYCLFMSNYRIQPVDLEKSFKIMPVLSRHQ